MGKKEKEMGLIRVYRVSLSRVYQEFIKSLSRVYQGHIPIKCLVGLSYPIN